MDLQDTVSNPRFKDIISYSSIGANDASIVVNSANFYRSDLNSNIQITIPLGANVGNLWTSPNAYLPINTFNAINTSSNVNFSSARDAVILFTSSYLHNILIQFKLTQSDGTNFTNQREIRTTLVQSDGITPYNIGNFSNQQPDSGQHDNILINQNIIHNLYDIVKIKFHVVQDNKLVGESDTLLTIMRISWNIIT